jgi:RimJ/RimL family protein N-acetyltransferase
LDIQPVELIGRRSKLIPLEIGHLPGLLDAGQFAEIWAYMPQNLMHADAMEAWIGEALRAQQQQRELPFTIVDQETGQIVGSTRLLDIDRPNRGVEIGWTWLTPTVWRTRVNTECKYLLLRHCFETLQAIRVQFKTDLRNERSQQAIARLGATREGVLRHQRILPDGYRRDSVYFSILEQEWPAVKARLEGRLESTPSA